MKELRELLKEIRTRSTRLTKALAESDSVSDELIRELAELNEISGGLVPMAFETRDKK